MSLREGRDLHPQDAPEVFVDLPRTMALTAAGKQFAYLRLLHAPDDQLIAPAATAGAGLPMNVSANRSDFSLLLHHRVPPQDTGGLHLRSSSERDRRFGNTEEVGGTRPYEGYGEI